MSRKHYKTKNYMYANGARKRYAHAVPAATMATADTVATAGTKLSAAEQFDRVAAVSTADVVTPTPAVTVKEPDPVAPAAKIPVAAVELNPVTVPSGNPQTPEPETKPAPESVIEEPAATKRAGNRTKWILLAAGVALVLFLILRKK